MMKVAGRALAIAAAGLLCAGGAFLEQRIDAVTMRGEPVTLLGPELKAGDPAPDFSATDGDFQSVRLEDFSGKIKIISAVPSLDTPVCSLETRRFNEMASELGEDVVILTISMDLPFAQKRWCGANGVDRVVTLSDYKFQSFGGAYGVLMENTRLLARTVFVVDKENIIRAVFRSEDQGQEPDYDAVLEAVRHLQ